MDETLKDTSGDKAGGAMDIDLPRDDAFGAALDDYGKKQPPSSFKVCQCFLLRNYYCSELLLNKMLLNLIIVFYCLDTAQNLQLLNEGTFFKNEIQVIVSTAFSYLNSLSCFSLLTVCF